VVDRRGHPLGPVAKVYLFNNGNSVTDSCAACTCDGCDAQAQTSAPSSLPAAPTSSPSSTTSSPTSATSCPSSTISSPTYLPTFSPVQDFSQNPCHLKKNAQASTCTTVGIPPGLCSACRFRQNSFIGFSEMDTVCDVTSLDSSHCQSKIYTCGDVLPELKNAYTLNKWGNFQDCGNMYHIDDACAAKIEQYATAHQTCDPIRSQYLVDITSSDPNKRQEALNGLDYFIYAMCEEVCDCIPYSAPRGAYDIDVSRGNCFAHAHYDIMRIFPDIMRIHKMGTPLPIEIPNVKAGLGNMLLNHSDWKGTYKVPFQGEEEMNIKAFLEQTMEALEADEPANWENCWALECSQNRI